MLIKPEKVRWEGYVLQSYKCIFDKLNMAINFIETFDIFIAIRTDQISLEIQLCVRVGKPKEWNQFNWSIITSQFFWLSHKNV